MAEFSEDAAHDAADAGKDTEDADEYFIGVLSGYPSREIRSPPQRGGLGGISSPEGRMGRLVRRLKP